MTSGTPSSYQEHYGYVSVFDPRRAAVRVLGSTQPSAYEGRAHMSHELEVSGMGWDDERGRLISRAYDCGVIAWDVDCGEGHFLSRAERDALEPIFDAPQENQFNSRALPSGHAAQLRNRGAGGYPEPGEIWLASPARLGIQSGALERRARVCA